ncbi:hypothetical protein [Planktothrix mougeotii]|uniref:Uncharacterized protein n=1 Tax=Planktothrix mougeotii LEGE 06226 TaxID=1828728 RepID=A0ABR9UFF5_9CYAN|nr:hypothetical protein [Planktothrix mougeotii]MBE9144556.1 hypothetical protein [Planktothrix mougeotii LEGE 06226]
MNWQFNLRKDKNFVLGFSLLLGTVLSHFTGLGLLSVQADEQQHHSASGHHKTVTIPPGQPIPTVDLIVHPDARQGWNLELKLTNFKLTPENVNQAISSYQEGHAHLYINGKKVTRIYGNWYYLPELPPGRHQIRVGLTGNGHEMLMVHDQEIADTEMIEVQE